MALHFKILGSLLLLFSSCGYGSTLTIHVGPTAHGSGGSNPLSVPPTSAQEYELVYVTKKKSEFTVGIVPGFFWGRRMAAKRVYASLGGGLVISVNGNGPGVYSAFGFDAGGKKTKFNMEYKQAIGISGAGTMINPYAIRMGVSFVF